MSDNRTNDILLDLKKNFLDDRKDLQDKIVEVETQIRQCNDFIESLNKKDDNDYNMFSPRSASRVYKDQVYEKKLEIEKLEEELRTYYKKLGNITKKIDSINELKPDELEDLSEKKVREKNDTRMLYIQMQEDDRQRIAAGLHDSVLQNLSLLMHNLELAEKFIDYDAVRAKLELESNRKLVKGTIDDIRNTIFDLRPMQFDDFGFKRTLENQLDGYRNRTNMEISYHIGDIDDKDNLILLSIFRIIQELVVNSIKHSNGKKIEVKVLDRGTSIYVEVTDDGQGISLDDLEKENHFGMKILKERVSMLGGVFSIQNVPVGSKVTIELSS